MSFVAAAVVGSTVISGVMQSNAADDASDAQRDSVRESNALQREMFDITRADNMPFLQTGYKANDQINALLAAGQVGKLPTFAEYTRDPSYAWQQKEAAKAVQGSAAARGGLYSGAAGRALSDRAQGIAASDYGNWWNRQQQGQSNQVNMLNAIRSGGQVAAGQVGAAGQSYASTAGGNLIGAGNALASSTLGQANALTGAANRASSYAMNWFGTPYAPGSSVTNGNLLSANASSDPLGSLISQKGW